MTTKAIWLFVWLCSMSIGLMVGNVLSDSPLLFSPFDIGMICGFALGGGLMALYPCLDQSNATQKEGE